MARSQYYIRSYRNFLQLTAKAWKLYGSWSKKNQGTIWFSTSSFIRFSQIAHLPHHSTYAPCSSLIPEFTSTRLRAFSIIDMRLTRLRTYMPLPLSISALRIFFLSCILLFQLKDKVPTFCMCAPVDHSTPSLSRLFHFTI